MKFSTSILALTVLALTAVFLSACHSTEQTAKQTTEHAADRPAPSQAIQFTLLHSNDHHGRFWANRHGEYGMAARKTLIDQIRAEVAANGGYSLLLSGGDINTGVPESDTLDAEPDFKGMSHLGYDAMAVGNHEFDNSVATIRQQEAWSDFPFLSANIYDADNQRLFAPYELFDFDGFTVGVIGLTTHETAFIGNREYVAGLHFKLPEPETEQLLPEVRAQADVVLALTHMGHTPSGLGSDVSLAKAVTGLDAIIGGHSAQALCVDDQGAVIDDYQPGMACVPDKINNTWIMQAEEWGRYLGRADFTFREGQLTLDRYQLIPVNLLDEQGQLVGLAIAQDTSTLALLEPFQQAGSQALTEVIGQASQTYSREVDDYLPQSSPLGQLITRAMMAATGADLALFNAGGIRSSLHQGDITMRDVLKAQPFNNNVMLQTFTGAELLNYLEAAQLFNNNAKELQYSGIDINANGQVRLGIKQQPIDPKASYVMALNSFMAHGGDGYPALTDNPRMVDTGMLDYQVLVDFIRANSPI